MAWAGGYVGDGVTTTNLAGRTLADLITGRDTDLARLPWVGHRSRRWEPEPIRWIGINGALRVTAGADAAEARTGRPRPRTWATGHSSAVGRPRERSAVSREGPGHLVDDAVAICAALGADVEPLPDRSKPTPLSSDVSWPTTCTRIDTEPSGESPTSCILRRRPVLAHQRPPPGHPVRLSTPRRSGWIWVATVVDHRQARDEASS